MRTSIAERLLYRLFYQFSWRALMKAKNPHKFLDPSTLWPGLAQFVQESMVGFWPIWPPLGEGTQVGLFFLPGLPNAHRLAMDYPHIVAPTRCQQMAIELLKGGHARHGHEEISAAKPH